jgi:hypothetical protein
MSPQERRIFISRPMSWFASPLARPRSRKSSEFSKVMALPVSTRPACVIWAMVLRRSVGCGVRLIRPCFSSLSTRLVMLVWWIWSCLPSWLSGIDWPPLKYSRTSSS